MVDPDAVDEDGDEGTSQKKDVDPVLQYPLVPDNVPLFVYLIVKFLNEFCDSARFIQGVSELQLLGFIKPTQRKTDHVQRLTWGLC